MTTAGQSGTRPNGRVESYLFDYPKQIFSLLFFVVGYLLIVGGYSSDKSTSTFGIRETEVVDVVSDISEGCGIRANYPDGIHPFETGGDMVGENAVVCGGYCRNEDCGNGE